MPTGYTHAIAEGQEVAAKDFILQCARAFGALVTMRDEPMDSEIPNEFEPSDYSIKQLHESEKELNRYQTISDKEAQIEIEDWYQKEVQRNKDRYEEVKSMKLRYENTLSDVLKWQPPTEEHTNLKDFCVKQLQDSIEWDCGRLDDYLKPVTKPDAKKWKQDKIDSCQRNIDYHTKSHKDEVERTNERTKWVQDLRKSLSELQ